MEYNLEYANGSFNYSQTLFLLFIVLLIMFVIYFAYYSGTINSSVSNFWWNPLTLVTCPECRKLFKLYQYEPDRYISAIREKQWLSNKTLFSKHLFIKLFYRQDAKNMCGKCILHTYPDPSRPIGLLCFYPRWYCICFLSESTSNSVKYKSSSRPKSSESTYMSTGKMNIFSSHIHSI